MKPYFHLLKNIFLNIFILSLPLNLLRAKTINTSFQPKNLIFARDEILEE